MTTQSQSVPLNITPGVAPSTDNTPLSTPHYTFANKVRFWRGRPMKIGGWMLSAFQYGQMIVGVARTLYSAVIGNVLTTVIGTDQYLYALYSQSLTNITPLVATSIAIPSSISTDYGTLGSNPIKTTSGSTTVVVTDPHAAKYAIGDNYTLSGASAFNGITTGNLNTLHIVRAIGTNTVSFMVPTAATATGSGGGASVVRSTGLLTFAATNTMSSSYRVKIAGAVDTAGITAAQINLEFIIRNVTGTTFDVMTVGTATSAVTAGGGTATVYYPQIAAGFTNASYGVGYGLGYYGAGLYGVSKSSNAGLTFPRIWFCDRFADRIVLNPGNQSAIYLWAGGSSVAPAILANAPTDVNYIFVSDNILVTFGHQNVNNQIFASDQGDATIWTASSTNQVFQDVVVGADRLISHVPVLGQNLIFTSDQTYTFSYIGLPLIWQIKLLDNSIGIIAPMARCSVNNTAFWMGQNNFYMWSGGNISEIPSNSGDQSTILAYVFNNINRGQASKSFAWYNRQFDEIWFHYPSASSNECDRIARVCLNDYSWVPDTFDRTCAEYPQLIFNYPRLISLANKLYNHESGVDADGSPMPWTLTSNLITSGKKTALITGFVPDSVQTGPINVNLSGYLWPQSTANTFNNNYTVTNSGPVIDTQFAGRYWQVTWSGDSLGQNWIMGQWSGLVEESSAR